VTADRDFFTAAIPASYVAAPVPAPLPATPTRRSLLPLLLTLVGVLVALMALRGAHHAAAGPVTGEAAGLTTTSGAAPPVQTTAHPQRLLAAVTAPAGGGAGDYVLESASHGQLVRWDPCRPIHYVVSGTEPFTGANQLLAQVLHEASAASGIRFVADGPTSEPASGNRLAYQPHLYGKRWAPVLISWTDAGHIARLGGPAIGLGGAASATVHGTPRLVSGIVYFDAPELSLLALRADGYAEMRTVMLHEIGHLLGLGHVADPNAVMFATNTGQGDYGAGDRRGLAAAGAGPCSRYS
jgi:hypothetical protein